MYWVLQELPLTGWKSHPTNRSSQELHRHHRRLHFYKLNNKKKNISISNCGFDYRYFYWIYLPVFAGRHKGVYRVGMPMLVGSGEARFSSRHLKTLPKSVGRLGVKWATLFAAASTANATTRSSNYTGSWQCTSGRAHSRGILTSRFLK